MGRRVVVVIAAVVIVGVAGLALRGVLQPPPERPTETALFGVEGRLLTAQPPVVGFSPDPLPQGFDVDELGRPAPLEALPRAPEATWDIARQAYGSTFLLGEHAGVPMHLFQLETGGLWDAMIGRHSVQDGVCFDAGAYGFCSSRTDLEMIESTRAWGPTPNNPGPGRRIGIWAPVPDGTAVVGLDVDDDPVAWQVPSGPAAVIVFDQPGEAEMVAYDADGNVIRRFTGRRP